MNLGRPRCSEETPERKLGEAAAATTGARFEAGRTLGLRSGLFVLATLFVASSVVAQPRDLANRTCPVLAGEATLDSVYADYQGVRVHFCCRDCRATFLSDPAQYLEILGVKPEPEPSAPASAAPTERVPPTNAAAVQRATDLLFNTSDEAAFLARRALRFTLITPPPAPPEPGNSAWAANPIDRFIWASWRTAGLPQADAPPSACDDATFCRRAFLDLVGIIPTIEESRRFEADPAPDKRERLIDSLLARDADYADHWTPFWEDALGSSYANLQGGVPTRGNYRQWINDSFKANKPFDLFAAQLIDTSMAGAKRPEIGDANGKKSRISYIRNETHTDTLQSAAATAQVFLGTGMKCASCHNHFENTEWPQARVLAFAGLFGPKDLEQIRCEKHSGKFIAAAFPFDLPGTPTDVPADEASRLRRVAQFLTDPTNPRFAKAIVNRLWKRAMGLGLFEPVDDFRLDVPPSHPELLDWLAYDFMASGYDLKHTIRLIMTSRTYQSRYDPALEDHFDVANKKAPRYFRSPTLRRLTAEQIVDSVRLAATQRLDAKSRLFLRNESTAMSRSLGKPASRNEISTGRADDAAVVQALELLNGEEFNALVYSSPILSPEVAADTSDSDAIDRLYRAVLSRPPTPEERAIAARYLRDNQLPAPQPTEAAETVWIDEDTPPSARLSGMWVWVDATDATPAAHGSRFHRQTATPEKDDKKPKRAQHFAESLALRPAVAPRDTLFAWVYLDPADPPREIMLQWNDGVMSNDGGWAHRAFWGEDLITFGHTGTPSRLRMGDLPAAGAWTRLEVPASAVGFVGAGTSIVGLSFDQVGGTVSFDASGVVSRGSDPAAAALGDLMWALVSSPEFQYTR